MSSSSRSPLPLPVSSKAEAKDASHHPIPKNDILSAVKILRGISTSDENCLFLVKDLLKFFRSGVMPEKLTKEKSGHAAPLAFAFKEQWESSGKQFKQTTAIEYKLDNSPQSYSENDSDDSDDEDEYIALTNPLNVPIRHSVDLVSERLRARVIKQKQILFGVILLTYVQPTTAESSTKFHGHYLAFYATPENVFFVDAQKLEGGVYYNRDKDRPIFSELSNAYHFIKDVTKPSKNNLEFSRYCFVTTVGEVALTPELIATLPQNVIEPQSPTKKKICKNYVYAGTGKKYIIDKNFETLKADKMIQTASNYEHSKLVYAATGQFVDRKDKRIAIDEERAARRIITKQAYLDRWVNASTGLEISNKALKFEDKMESGEVVRRKKYLRNKRKEASGKQADQTMNSSSISPPSQAASPSPLSAIKNFTQNVFNYVSSSIQLNSLFSQPKETPETNVGARKRARYLPPAGKSH